MQTPLAVKNIAVFQHDLQTGGIQKSLINLLNLLDRDKYKIDLFLFEKDDYFDVSFSNNINIIRIEKWNPLLKVIPFSLTMAFCRPHYTDKKYDIAIDYNSYKNQCAMGAISVVAKKRVMWIHSNIEQKLKHEPKYRLLWWLSKAKFKHFDEFVAVSNGIVEPFCEISGISYKPITVIQNCIDAEKIIQQSNADIGNFGLDQNKFNIVALGRLCRVKGFDILIDFMSKLIIQRKDFHLYIIGDGPEKQNLLKQVEQKQLGQYITMLGRQKNPYAYMSQMDAFVSTSRYEGQGINIMEARALGLPVFITKNLEPYNVGIKGCDDIVKALSTAQKQQKKVDLLVDYHREIHDKINKLFS